MARQERARVLEMGIVSTHLHLLLQLHPVTSIPRLLQRMKGGSAVMGGREGHCAPDKPLRWAKGYSIASVSARALDAVGRYVRDQASHHPDLAI